MVKGQSSSPNNIRMTPMLEQYLSLKEKAGSSLLFFRMGDFFELFFEDAKLASSVLDIALTSRGELEGKIIPMCGVPVHSSEGYLARLIKAGLQVAIADQVETPEQAKIRAKSEGLPASKALVKRAIVRFVTPGTITEENLLEPKKANLIASFVEVRDTIGIASCDISTGQMILEDCHPHELDSVLSSIPFSECLMPEDWGKSINQGVKRPKVDFNSEKGRTALAEIHNVTTLDGFGDFSRAMLAAANGLITYLNHVGCGCLPLLLPPKLRKSTQAMSMDRATRMSLEILTSQAGTRTGSLIETIDRCSTAAGARLLAEDLSFPLMSIESIEERLSLVSWLHHDSLSRNDLRMIMRNLPDLGRALGRVVADRGTPRDLGQIRDALNHAKEIEQILKILPDIPSLLERLLPDLTGHEELINLFNSALVESPPTDRKNGGFIADGYDPDLDELRQASSNARQAIAAMENRYREITGVASLKIKHNGVLGYFIEVPTKYADALMAPNGGFAHRQTMAGAMRFNSVALHEEANKISQAGGLAIAQEELHFQKLVGEIRKKGERIALAASALARIDVSASHAERAAESRWCRPKIYDEPKLNIRGGRHPVVESALAKKGERFVANDCLLSTDDRLWLIGGPNMGGKSTFLRQNALIILLAQCGSFIPAKSADVGIVDRLFSRVGASDNLADGRSTFMVEMVETAAILSQSSEKSFVILDEVGRGTSTYDGLALAWAVTEAVHSNLQCRCLFATHYHELSMLSTKCEALSLHHVKAKEFKGDLILLHELSFGSADKSYGLEVARLAGVPTAVVDRARQVLKQLEENRSKSGGLAVGLGELPLFSASREETKGPEILLYERLLDIDIDALSPREALEKLYDLSSEARAAKK